MTRVHEVTKEELEKRRAEILSRLETSYEDLAEKALAHRLVADEWEAWEEIREIDFLLEGE